MRAPRCLLIGAGCMAGGFVAPLLRDAGWEIILVSRSRSVVETINEGGGLWVRTGADLPEDRWVGGISAVSLWDPILPHLAARADLLATAVGASALPYVGRTLAPLLRARLAASEDPINAITFENHRRAPELLAARLIEEDPFLAPTICRTVGIGGAAVWRTIPHRTITSRGIRFDVEGADECYADALALIPGVPPLDDSVPGIELVRAFDDRMIVKLWIFNAGHAAAAYLGWQYGCRAIREAMEHQPVRAAVAGVVTEAQRAVEAYLGRRPGSVPLPPRSSNWILDSYANPRLDDPIVRVAREPRRKLGADDRLIGPGIACLAAGFRPLALADAMAAALGYAEPNDPQATDLQREIDHGLFPILATEYAGLSTAQAGLIYSLSAVVFVIAGPFYVWITDRYGRLVGIASRSAANIGSSVMYMVSPTFVGMAAARSVDNIGKAAFRHAWASAITDIAAKDPPRKGRRLGTLDAMQEIGEIAGPALAGILWQTGGVFALFGVRIAIAIIAEISAIVVFGELQIYRPRLRILNWVRKN